MTVNKTLRVKLKTNKHDEIVN